MVETVRERDDPGPWNKINTLRLQSSIAQQNTEKICQDESGNFDLISWYPGTRYPDIWRGKQTKRRQTPLTLEQGVKFISEWSGHARPPLAWSIKYGILTPDLSLSLSLSLWLPIMSTVSGLKEACCQSEVGYYSSDQRVGRGEVVSSQYWFPGR